jgi:hypothetical protein
MYQLHAAALMCLARRKAPPIGGAAYYFIRILFSENRLTDI